jgi:hypothetical protein
MAEPKSPPPEGISTFWKTTGLLGLVGILGTLLVAFIDHRDAGNPAPATTGVSTTAAP